MSLRTGWQGHQTPSLTQTTPPTPSDTLTHKQYQLQHPNYMFFRVFNSSVAIRMWRTDGATFGRTKPLIELRVRNWKCEPKQINDNHFMMNCFWIKQLIQIQCFISFKLAFCASATKSSFCLFYLHHELNHPSLLIYSQGDSYSQDFSRVHAFLCVTMSLDPSLIKHRFWAAAPKGSMTYAFTQGNFLPLLLLLLVLLRTPPPHLQAHISASKPISQPRGPNPSLEAEIPGLEGGIQRRRRRRRKFPVWKHRSLTPSGPLPKKAGYTISIISWIIYHAY